MPSAILRTRPDVRAGLVAQYLLNEGNYYDTSGHGLNPTTIQAVTIVNGPKGNWATNFVRANSSYISPGSPALIAQQGALSVSFWINSTAPGSSTYTVCASSSGGTNAAFIVTMGAAIAGKLDWWNNPAGVNFTSSAAVNDGNWHHVVGSRSGSAGSWTITFYIDGAKDSSGSTAQDPTGPPQQFSIGRLGSFSGDYFTGSLFDVRIYNRALSQAETNMLYNGLWVPVELEPSIMMTAASGIAFRRTASMLGTRARSRQVWQ